MAKTVKITKDTEIPLSSKLFDTVYEIAAPDAKITFVENRGALTSTFFLSPIKSGNDLIMEVDDLISGYGLITIKDYYALVDNYDNHDLANYKEYDFWSSTWNTNTLYAQATDPDIFFYSEETTVYAINSKIYGAKNSQKYIVSNFNFNQKQNQICDIAGNERYKFASGSTSSVHDYVGNDVYNFMQDSTTDIIDFGGSDTYNVIKANAVIGDFGGNNTFRIKNGSNANISLFVGNNKFDILDSVIKIEALVLSGNDKYTGYGITSSGDDDIAETYSKINDNQGNDSYNYTNSKFGYIRDFQGNDSYNLTTFSATELADFAGNDKYNLVNYAYYNDGGDLDDATITDEKGNDTYNINIAKSLTINEGEWDNEGNPLSTGGNDTYNASAADKLEICEASGNDKYNVSDSHFVGITDYLGNDTYNLDYVISHTALDKNSILDHAGNDKYQITNSKYVEVNEKDKGNETYVIKNSDIVNLTDEQGKDKYTISEFSTNVLVDDLEGADIYNVSDSFNVGITDSDLNSNDIYNFTNLENYDIATYFVTDEGGNEKYNIKDSASIGIADNKGIDNYNIQDSVYVQLHDKGEGKDTYNVKNSSQVLITDENNNIGFNIYTVTNVDDLFIDDENEADTIYNLTNVKISDSGVYYLSDESGNDKWTIKDSKNLVINDKGNGVDNCTITNSTATINEMGDSGNDKYNITKSDVVDIIDDGGDDIYTAVNSKYVSIIDTIGDDKYTLTNHNLQNYYLSSITDSDGMDTYTINNLKRGITIIDNDESGIGDVDKYNITNAENVNLYDNSMISNDIYNFTNVFNNVGVIVSDAGGNDTYTIKNSALVFVDTSGNDKYTIDNLKNKIEIWDTNGIDDNVTITGLASKNIVWCPNFTADGSNLKASDGSLYIFDRTQKNGSLTLGNFIKTEDVAGETRIVASYDYQGTGYIENLNAGKASLNDRLGTYLADEFTMNGMGSLVAGWLSSTDGHNSYGSVSDLLASENQADIQSFVLYISGGGYPV